MQAAFSPVQRASEGWFTNEKNKVVIAGTVGAGLMWGWLMVLYIDRFSQEMPVPNPNSDKKPPAWLGGVLNFLAALIKKVKRPYLNLIAVAIFSSGFAWLIYTLSDATMLIPFFMALILAFSVHFAWRQRLRRAQRSS